MIEQDGYFYIDEYGRKCRNETEEDLDELREEDLDELREEDRLDALGIPLEEREKE